MANCVEALDRCIQILQRMQTGEKMEPADQSEIAMAIEQLQAARQEAEVLGDKRWEAKRFLILATVGKVAEAIWKIVIDLQR